MIERRATNRMAQRDQRGFYGDLQDAGVTPDVDTQIRRLTMSDPITELLGVEDGAELVARFRLIRGTESFSRPPPGSRPRSWSPRPNWRR